MFWGKGIDAVTRIKKEKYSPFQYLQLFHSLETVLLQTHNVFLNLHPRCISFSFTFVSCYFKSILYFHPASAMLNLHNFTYRNCIPTITLIHSIRYKRRHWDEVIEVAWFRFCQRNEGRLNSWGHLSARTSHWFFKTLFWINIHIEGCVKIALQDGLQNEMAHIQHSQGGAKPFKIMENKIRQILAMKDSMRHLADHGWKEHDGRN